MVTVRDLAAPTKLQSSDLGFGEFFIAAYEAILLVRGDADHVPAQVLYTVANGWSQEDRAALEALLEVFVRPDDIKQSRILGALQRNLFFARVTGVRFSEQIDELHDNLFNDRGWEPDDGKTRHILEAFAWLKGDKAMSDYEPSDIDTYVRRMALIHQNFTWGHLHKFGAMAEPFDPGAFPKPKASERRSDRTINIHLSKPAAAVKILKKRIDCPDKASEVSWTSRMRASSSCRTITVRRGCG